MSSTQYQIGIVTRYFPPSIGGVQTHVTEIADELSKQGYKIRFFTCEQREANVDIECTVYRYDRYNQIIDIPLLSRRLHKFVSACDIIHVHSVGGQLSTLAEIVASVSNTPVTLTAHGIGIVDHPEYGFTDRFWHKTTRWMSLKYANNVISTCPHFTDISLRYIDSSRIHEIPNGIDTRFFTPDRVGYNPFSNLSGVQNESNIILSVNMIKPVKGMQYMIQALPRILHSHPNTHYVIIGDGGYKSNLKQMADDLNVRENIHFPGETTDDEHIRACFRSASVAVVPSSGESTSISALEALATECPLVASPVGGIKELIGENERGRIAEIFPPGSYQRSAPSTLPHKKIISLADEILWVLSNPGEAKKLARQGRKYVIENYDWSVIANQVEKVYLNLI